MMKIFYITCWSIIVAIVVAFSVESNNPALNQLSPTRCAVEVTKLHLVFFYDCQEDK